jgi:hypothetical protein
VQQSTLLETVIDPEFEPHRDRSTEIIFREYEPYTGPEPENNSPLEPTGRTWSGVVNDRALFDILTKAGVITLDMIEAGTGVKVVPEEKKKWF